MWVWGYFLTNSYIFVISSLLEQYIWVSNECVQDDMKKLFFDVFIWKSHNIIWMMKKSGIKIQKKYFQNFIYISIDNDITNIKWTLKAPILVLEWL